MAAEADRDELEAERMRGGCPKRRLRLTLLPQQRHIVSLGHPQPASRGGCHSKTTNTAGRGGLTPPRFGNTLYGGGSDPPKGW